MNLAINITPSPIPTRRAFTTPVVAHVQAIAATPIASRQAWTTPVIKGGPKYLIPSAIASRQSWTNPTVTGGALKGIQIFLGGVEVTEFYKEISCSFTSQTIGRWQASLSFFNADGSFTPTAGQTVLIVDYGVKKFAGCIQQVDFVRAMSTVQAITFNITCVDKAGICDRRVITGKTYPAGSDIYSVIADINQNYLNGEGLTIKGVPNDGSLGTLDADLPCNYNYVTQAFDAIAQDSGTIWFVDVDGNITFNSLDVLPASPFQIEENSGNWFNLTSSQTTLDFRTTQYAVSNRNVLPGATPYAGGGGASGSAAVVETFTWANGQPGIHSQLINTGGGSFFLLPQSIVTSLPIGVIQSITVNGNPQTVFEFTAFTNQQSTGPNDFLWSYASQNSEAGQNTSADQAEPAHGPLPTNATVVVTYIPATQNAAGSIGVALAPSAPAGGAPTVGGLGTCGSGNFEAVEQVTDITDQTMLNSIAIAVLARKSNGGKIPVMVTYTTDQPGISPGQIQEVNLPLVYADAVLILITQVQAVHMAADVGFGSTKTANPQHSSFRYTVTGTTNLDPGNWIKWYERLIRRTQNPFPVYQFEEAPFALELDGSNVGGIVNTNPYIVKRTGQLFDMHVAFSVAPVDQHVTYQFLVNGVLVPGSITITPSSSVNTDNVYVFPLGSPYFVFSRPPTGPNDIITIRETFQVTGANPTNPQNVTAFMRWRI